MSEADKRRRLAYKQNRKKWILVQIGAIALLLVLALVMSVLFINLNKTYYVSYTERGNADYTVTLKDNDFYEDDAIAGGQGYISELIHSIDASFRYEMRINATDVTYDYSRYIDARLEIIDKTTDKLLYSPTYTLMDEARGTAANALSVVASASIDYGTYNSIAQRFINTYKLENVKSRLVVTMHVSATGSSDEFDGETHNAYSTSVIIPLCEKTIAIEASASAPDGESGLLPCHRDINPLVFKVLGIVFAVLALLAAVFMLVFIRLTRNEDIDYEQKVKRLLNAYRSYIQVILNEFDSEGYQVLTLGTFNEMLGIRDTIQSPILMHENEDKTRTLFFIPTNTKILYVFEIKVDDYDEIYASAPVEEEPVEELPAVEEPAIEEPVVEEPVEEPAVETAVVEELSVSIDEIDYVEDDDMEEEEGIEVIGVVWPEHKKKNKVYKYDPNGEKLQRGDVVLVPSRDKHQNRDIVRQAAVAHGNYKVDPDAVHFPLKKIIGVVKRSLQSQLGK